MVEMPDLTSIIATFDLDGSGGDATVLEVIATVIIGISVVLGALAIIFKFFFKAPVVMWMAVKQFLEDWNGEPARDGYDARNGIKHRLQEQEKGQAEIVKNQGILESNQNQMKTGQAEIVKNQGILKTNQDQMKANQEQIKTSLHGHITAEDASLVVMRGEMSVMAKKIDTELNPNGGSTMKDAAHEALRIVQEMAPAVQDIKDKQEAEGEQRKIWHARYLQELETIRQERSDVFDGIKGMIGVSPEEQAVIWAKITAPYMMDDSSETPPV
jgi:hypothetical protein